MIAADCGFHRKGLRPLSTRIIYYPARFRNMIIQDILEIGSTVLDVVFWFLVMWQLVAIRKELKAIREKDN